MAKVVLVTTTFYKNATELRFKLACQMIEAARDAGLPLVIVDGSPSGWPIKAFKKRGALVYPQLEKGMGGSRRQTFMHGVNEARRNGAEVVLWLEPEKADVVRSVPKIVQPILSGEADIVIPARTKEAWASYPAFQVESEQEGNRKIAAANGRSDLDFFFGPVACDMKWAEFLSTFNPSGYGVADTYLPQYVSTYALKRGARMASVTVDFVYPPEQRAEEEGAMNDDYIAKRKSQLAMLTKAHETLAAA